MVNIKKRENVRDVMDKKRKKILLGLVRDLHPLDNTHASQTKRVRHRHMTHPLYSCRRSVLIILRNYRNESYRLPLRVNAEGRARSSPSLAVRRDNTHNPQGPHAA